MELPKVEGIELPTERTFLTVQDLKEGEEGFINASNLFFTGDRKGVLFGTTEILRVNPGTWAQFPVLKIRKNKSLFDVTIYFKEGFAPCFTRAQKGTLEDGGKVMFYLSSYKEFLVNRNTTTYAQLPKDGEETTNKAKTPKESTTSKK